MNNQQQDYELHNPLLINFIILSESESGKNMIELWTFHGKYKQLSMSCFQWKMLIEVGVNPNDLIKGQRHYVNFYAHWKTSDKTNSKGNQYKNVVRLTQVPTQAEMALIEAVEHQNDLLTLIGINQFGNRMALMDEYKELKKRQSKQVEGKNETAN